MTFPNAKYLAVEIYTKKVTPLQLMFPAERCWAILNGSKFLNFNQICHRICKMVME